MLLSPCTCRQQGSAHMSSRGGCEPWLPSWTPDAGTDRCCCCHLPKKSVSGCHWPHLPRSQHGLSLLRVLWSRTNIPRSEDGPLLLKRTLWPGTNHCSHLPGVQDTLLPPRVPGSVANFPKDWWLTAATARDPQLGGNHRRTSLGVSTCTPPIKGTTASIGWGKKQQASKLKTALKSKTKIEFTQATQGHCCLVTNWCLALCNPMDCSLPGFPVLHYLKELVKLMSIESMKSSNHLILCYHLLLLLSIFPSIRVFSMGQLFTSGGQSIRASASALVFPMTIKGWFPLGWTSLISWLSKGLSRVFSNTTVKRHHS